MARLTMLLSEVGDLLRKYDEHELAQVYETWSRALASQSELEMDLTLIQTVRDSVAGMGGLLDRTLRAKRARFGEPDRLRTVYSVPQTDVEIADNARLRALGNEIYLNADQITRGDFGGTGAGAR